MIDTIPGRTLDQVYTDLAEVPAVAQFAEVNTSLIVLIFAAFGVGCLIWVLYRRTFGAQAADVLVDLPEERILENDRLVLSLFYKRHPDHPSAGRVAMELGRRYYDDLEYNQSSYFFLQVIQKDRSAKNPEAHFFLAHCLQRMGYVCDAIDEWMACYMDDPKGELAQEAFREAQRWRARQIVEDKDACPSCGADCRLTDLHCRRCEADLKRTLIECGVCGKTMVKEAKLCIHCLPDDIKSSVALGTDWPVVKTTSLDWEAELVKSRLVAADIPCVLTGEKGGAIPLTVGHLGQIDIRVPYAQLAEAGEILSLDVRKPADVASLPEPEDQSAAVTAAEIDSAPAFVPSPEEEEHSNRIARIGKWLLLCLGLFLIAVFFRAEIEDWKAVSVIDGEKIRRRDLGVSIHDPAVMIPGVANYKEQRQGRAREFQRHKQLHLEANILRRHLFTEGDTSHAALADEELVQWGISEERIRRP